MTLAQARPEDRDATLLRAATALFCQEPIHDRDALRRFEQLAIHLLPKLRPTDRGYVASLLSGRKDAPPAIMRTLARDVFEVASPVLRYSSALSTIDFLGVIAATGPEHHQLIATRSDLTADVLRALDIAKQKTLTIEEAESPESSDEAAAVPANEITDESVPQEPQSLAGGLTEFLDAPLEDRLRILREASSGRWPKADTTARSSGRLDEVLRRSHATAQIVIAAKKRDRAGLIAAFSQSLGITSDTAAKLMADPSGEPLVLMVRATGLSDADGRTVLLLANKQIAESVDAFFRLADLYASLEPATAEAFVEAWRPSQPKRPPTRMPVYSQGAERSSPTVARPEVAAPMRKSGTKD